MLNPAIVPSPPSFHLNYGLLNDDVFQVNQLGVGYDLVCRQVQGNDGMVAAAILDPSFHPILEVRLHVHRTRATGSLGAGTVGSNAETSLISNL